MFTGLVETTGRVVDVESRPPGVRLVIREPTIAAEAGMGDSISVAGCCLTVVAIDGDCVGFDAGDETLSRTNLGRLATDSRVNLERSLKVGDQLGGHYVTGHVDALGELVERIDEADWSKFWFRVPSQLSRQLASKGSVAVDGVSLTLVDVTDDNRFSVALIPHTLSVTTLGELTAADPVNIETDVLAKYVERQLQGRT